MQNVCAFSIEELQGENPPRRRIVLIYMPDHCCIAALPDGSAATELAIDFQLRAQQEYDERRREIWAKRTQNCVCHIPDSSESAAHSKISSSTLIAQCKGVDEISVTLPIALYQSCDMVQYTDSYGDSTKKIEPALRELTDSSLWEILVKLQKQAPTLAIKLTDGKELIPLDDVYIAVQGFRRTRKRADTVPQQGHHFEHVTTPRFNTLPRNHRVQIPRYMPPDPSD